MKKTISLLIASIMFGIMLFSVAMIIAGLLAFMSVSYGNDMMLFIVIYTILSLFEILSVLIFVYSSKCCSYFLCKAIPDIKQFKMVRMGHYDSKTMLVKHKKSNMIDL